MDVFIVNRVAELKAHQTTTRLIEATRRAGRRAFVTDVLSLSVHSPTDVRGLGVEIADGSASVAEICERVRTGTRTHTPLQKTELVVIRTSPGRDLDQAWAHRLALQAARLVRDAGVPVVNDPVGLDRASSKLYGACLPADVTPRTLVAHDRRSVETFIRELGGPAVIKPLLGSQGRDVFIVDRVDDRNLGQICDILGRTGYLIVQEYLPAAEHGDVRILLLDGEVLGSDRAPAAVHRIPRLGEFRSNVALGAEVQPATLTARQLEIAGRVARRVARDGIRLSGLDLIGDHVVEVNVFSTGGIVDAELFAGEDYATAVMDALRRPPGS